MLFGTLPQNAAPVLQHSGSAAQRQLLPPRPAKLASSRSALQTVAAAPVMEAPARNGSLTKVGNPHSFFCREEGSATAARPVTGALFAGRLPSLPAQAGPQQAGCCAHAQEVHERVYNFSAGPAVLPVPVLEQARADLLNWQGSGMSVMEMSHRGPEFTRIIAEAEADLRALLGIPGNYRVLFLQGGATQQFAAIPLNLTQPGDTVDQVPLPPSWHPP